MPDGTFVLNAYLHQGRGTLQLACFLMIKSETPAYICFTEPIADLP